MTTQDNMPGAPPAPPSHATMPVRGIDASVASLEPVYWLLGLLLIVGVIDMALTAYVAYHLWRFIAALHQLGG